MYRPSTGIRNQWKAEEVVIAFDAASGKTIWEYRYPTSLDTMNFSRTWAQFAQSLFGLGPLRARVADQVFQKPSDLRLEVGLPGRWQTAGGIGCPDRQSPNDRRKRCERHCKQHQPAQVPHGGPLEKPAHQGRHTRQCTAFSTYISIGWLPGQRNADLFGA
jgi:hypothetical protein